MHKINTRGVTAGVLHEQRAAAAGNRKMRNAGIKWEKIKLTRRPIFCWLRTAVGKHFRILIKPRVCVFGA